MTAVHGTGSGVEMLRAFGGGREPRPSVNFDMWRGWAFCRPAALAAAVMLPLLAAGQAEAACTAVGTDVTCTGTTSGVPYGFDGTSLINPTATVEPGANVEGTSAGFTFSNGTVFNSGTVSGPAVSGIYDFDSVTVTNTLTGIISGYSGIYAGNATVTNAGGISGTDTGVNTPGNAKVTNSGNISGANYGINAGTTATVINTGTGYIHGGGIGVQALNGSANVTNAGVISGGVIGIRALAGGANINNTGTISAGSYGIYISGSSSGGAIINSGSIIAPLSGSAILSNTTSPLTLTFLPGTAIQGAITLAASGLKTLNIGTGLNTALTFDVALPTTINTNGQPYVLSGKTLAVVDPTGFAAADRFALDFAGSVTDAVDGRMAPVDDGAMTTGSVPGAASPERRGFWVTGLGFYGNRQASASLDGFDYGAFGLMAGVDRSLSASTLAGVFGGIATGGIETAAGSTNIDATGAFTGAYWSKDDGKTFAHLSFAAGGFLDDSSRTVANNQVAGGLETASASYGSFYVDPALTFGLHRQVGMATVSPSLRLRYTGLYQQGYTESGSAADMTVADRFGQAFDVRGEIRTDFAPRVSEAGVGRFYARAGVDGLFTWSGDIDATLLATPIAFATNEPQAVARGFIAAGTTFTAANGLIFKADAEAGYDTANTLTVSAKASVHKTF